MSIERGLRREADRTFEVFGSRVRVLVGVPREPGCAAPELASWTLEQRFRDLHRALTRFDPASELCRLNRSPEATVPVSADMAMFLLAAKDAARSTDGLVDATRVEALEQHGYGRSRTALDPASLADALARAPNRHPATARAELPWDDVIVNVRRGAVTRPPGLRFDSGGIAKGLAADIGAQALRHYSSFAVDCGGDLCVGGVDGLSRMVDIDDPYGARPPARFSLSTGAVATTGVNRRIWARGNGFAHHLIDPATDAPAWTGLIQATAVAPTGVEAEALAKAAFLAGPDGADRWLARWGGAVFADDGALHALGPLRAQLVRIEVAA